MAREHHTLFPISPKRRGHKSRDPFCWLLVCADIRIVYSSRGLGDKIKKYLEGGWHWLAKSRKCHLFEKSCIQKLCVGAKHAFLSLIRGSSMDKTNVCVCTLFLINTLFLQSWAFSELNLHKCVFRVFKPRSLMGLGPLRGIFVSDSEGNALPQDFGLPLWIKG